MKYGLEFPSTNLQAAPHETRKPMIKVKIDPNPLVTQGWSNIIPTYALIDTGADFCLFDTNTVDINALNPIDNVAVESRQTGAGTKRNTYLYRMSILFPDDSKMIEISFIPIAMDSNTPHKFILGMNFLRNTTLVIHYGARSGYIDIGDMLPV